MRSSWLYLELRSERQGAPAHRQVSNEVVLCLTGAVGGHHAPARLLGHTHRLNGLGDGANLVYLEQQRGEGLGANGALHTLRVGHQRVITHNLSAATECAEEEENDEQALAMARWPKHTHTAASLLPLALSLDQPHTWQMFSPVMAVAGSQSSCSKGSSMVMMGYLEQKLQHLGRRLLLAAVVGLDLEVQVILLVLQVW